MLARLARHLRLEVVELQRALLLSAALFALTASYTLVKTARDTFFLVSYPASVLPWVFLAVGAFALAATLVFSQFTRRRSPVEALALTSIVSALVLLGFAWALRARVAAAPFAFYLWVNAYGVTLLSQFWIYANSVSDPREAKRILGLVGTGGILGGLAGGLVAGPIASGPGTVALIAAGALPLAGVAMLVFWRVRHHATTTAVREPVAPGRPLANAYVRWLALSALCSVVVTGLLDYQFKVEIQSRYADPARLASFLGAFYSLVNLASLGVQVFFTRWALQSLGAGWSAAVLPTGLGIGAALTLLVPGFGSVLTSRLWDQVLRQSLNRAANEIFYFPLEPGLRRRAKQLIDAGIERAGDGLAGLVILAAGAAMSVSVGLVAVLVSALVVGWVLAWMGVRRGYVNELAKNLRRMNLEHREESVSLREASLLAEMQRLIDSPYERVVLHGVELIEDNAPEALEAIVPRLLAHASSAVRSRALSIVAARRLSSFAAAASEHLHDPDPAVRVEALRARCVLEGGSPDGAIDAFLEDPDVRLRAAALELLVEFCGDLDLPRVQARLEERLRAGAPEERRAIASALARREPPHPLHDLLGALLKDPVLEVRRTALESAGAVQRRNHIPILLEALGERATCAAARLGLARFGDKVTGTLADYLADASVTPSIRHVIPRVLADIGTQEAARALERLRERHDVRLAYRVLKAQNKIRVRSPEVEFDRRIVREQLEADVRACLFAFVHYRACPIGERASAERLFCVALSEREEQALNRVFRRLALVYPPGDLFAAYRGVTSDSPRLRGSALEFLENALDAEDRALVLPLVEGGGDEALMRLAAQRFGLRGAGFEGALAAALEGDDQWLRACALYVVGSRRERSLAQSVVSALSAADLRVRETANWATLALGTSS